MPVEVSMSIVKDWYEWLVSGLVHLLSNDPFRRSGLMPCTSLGPASANLILLSILDLACFTLIETLYRENVSFRDRDLKRFKRCHMASENFDAELLLNIQVSI